MATAGELAQVQKLADDLQKDANAKANNIVHLVNFLNTSRHEATIKAAIQGLKLFFVDASQDGDLGSKRQKVEAAQQPASQEAADDGAAAEDVYRQWLKRQYNSYIQALLGLLTSEQATAGVQVSAMVACMEAVRCEAGVGVFANTLYTRVLSTVVNSPATKPEVFTLLFTRYFTYADVRYYTLTAVRSIALDRTSKPDSAPGTEEGAAGSQAPVAAAASGKQAAPAKGAKQAAGKKAGKAEAVPASTGAAQGAAAAAAAGGAEVPAPGSAACPGLPLEDLARNLFDVLSNLPDSLGGGASGAAAATAAAAAGEQQNGAAPELKSWCGLAEVGAVSATSYKNESARARRKRRAMEGLKPGQSSASEAAAAEQKASWANLKTQKRAYSDAWLSFLQLPVPEDIYRKVLLRLHSAVIPNMMNPVMLADFLTYSLNQGGMVGMLALNGIFVLVTRHGLEYPAFFCRLYQLITPEAFRARHRAQFFKLADIFLSSALVPAYTVAAFCKRLARLALSAPPAGALIAVAFVHNLIRRHPALVVLLHRPLPGQTGGSSSEAAEAEAAAAAAGAGRDVYDEVEPDPARSRAVESSLWELQALRNHYCPQVSTLCAVLDKDLTERRTTSEVDLEPLLAASYASLINQEATRRLKQVPVAFYQQPPTKLFDLNCHVDFAGWSF